MESSHIKKPKCSSHIELKWDAFYNNENEKQLMELTNEGGTLFAESFPAPSCSLTHELARVGRYRIRFNSLVKVMLLAKRIPEEKSWQQSNMDNGQSQVSDTF